MPILRTRLHKPPVGDPFILRERLMDRLDEGVKKPLTLVVGGAGYGKSVLVSQWLDEKPQTFCWVSLEEDCNDLQVFLSYLVAGIQQTYPKGMSKLAQLIESNVFPPNEVIVQTLSNDLSEIDGKITIVLDDLHKIDKNEIFDLLNRLIYTAPENVRLILISRVDPPLKKARMQAYNQLCEIRMADLRLNLSEIIELAEKSAHMTLTSETASLIEAKTEGWVLGVNLLLKDSIAKGPEQGLGILDAPINQGTNVLYELVKQDIDSDLLKILMLASLFERFDYGLITKLFDGTQNVGTNNDLLERQFKLLQSRGTAVYLIALDPGNEWYRLHHLVGEVLNKSLVQHCTVEEIEAYYRIAGAYFARIDCYEEGIRYALLGKSQELAVQIIESKWEDLIDNAENLRLNRWIQMLPADTSNTDPTILVIRAFLCDNFADYDAMKTYLENASKRMDQNTASPRLLGAFASVHSCFSTYTNDFATAVNYANLALDRLLPDQSFLRDYALLFKIFSTCMIKSPTMAQQMLDKALSNPYQKSGRHLMRINVIKLFFDWNQATIKDLKHSAKIVVDICLQEKIWWMYKMGSYYLGQYYYMKSQIREVYAYIDNGIDCFFNSSPVWALQLYYSGVLAALAENHLPKAHNYLKSASKFVELNQLDAYKGFLSAFEVEFALRTDDVKKAWELNASANYTDHPPVYFYYIPQFTQIKLYIQKGDPDLLKQARHLIHQYRELTGNILYAQIQITLLEALWYAKSGLNEKAISTLIEALTLTPEEDYIRVFLDMGEPVKKLFTDLPEDQKQTPLVRNILIALDYEQNNLSVNTESNLLTSKEVEVMELVSGGLTNREIAAKMYLSEATIKAYLHKVYQKLGVKNRTGALLQFHQIKPS